MPTRSSPASVENHLIKVCVNKIGLYRHGQLNIQMLLRDLGLFAETYTPSNPESVEDFETAWQNLLRLALVSNPDDSMIDTIDEAVDTFECVIRGL